MESRSDKRKGWGARGGQTHKHNEVFSVGALAKVGCRILVQGPDRDDVVGKLRDPAYPDVERRQGTRGGDGALTRVARHTQLAGTPCRPWGQLGQRGSRQGQGRSTEKERRQDRACAPHLVRRC
jgi:hypothetical protein